ncbi:MAG: hypothetical protein GYB68_07360 [Chloroflexi bacterium]|nr:hypothetical protein [Chloroflexota bacterium]
MSDELPLTLKARPSAFIRHKKGLIEVRTLPGATCTIRAIYSTGRHPRSLPKEPVKANRKGVAAWHWRIGSSGSRLDVTVWAWHNDYESSHAKLHISIDDIQQVPLFELADLEKT